MEFDKDDKEAMDFVYTAANLRAYNYSIQTDSRFKIKEIAGNIVPAVSSTNGLVGALETTEAIKVLTKNFDQLMAINYKAPNMISVKMIDDPQNKSCAVCSNTTLMMKLVVDPETFTLDNLIGQVLQQEMSISSPMIERSGAIIFESGDDLDEDEVELYDSKRAKKLVDLKVQSGDIMNIEDFNQAYKMNIEISF